MSRNHRSVENTARFRSFPAPSRAAAALVTLALAAAGCGELDQTAGEAAEAADTVDTTTGQQLATLPGLPGPALPGPALPGPALPGPGIPDPGLPPTRVIPIPDIEPPLFRDPVRTPIRELEQGDGWRRIQVTGSAEDGDTGATEELDEEFYVFQGRAAIDRAPSLHPRTRAAVAQSMARDGGKGSPLAQATGDDPDDEEIIIVPARSRQVIEREDQVRTIGFCDDETKNYSKTYNFDRSFNHTKSTVNGSFHGSASFSARLQGSATATVKYKIKRDWYTLCAPIIVIQKVTLAASSDLLASAALNAEFQRAWSWQREIAAPTLATFIIPGVYIPVTVSLPIDVGLNAAGRATLNATARYSAHARFDVGCKSSGCSGTRSATHGFTPSGTPSMDVTGRVKVTPWVMASVRASVIADWLASAEVGVRAGVPTDLFAYAGNTCGDGNGDGSNEAVSATTVDLSLDVDLVVGARFLVPVGTWTWGLLDRHLAFWKLGGDSAIDPIFHDTSVAGGTVTMAGKMRPCWPYNDAVNYRVLWSDGTMSNFTAHPDTLNTLSHPFAAFGIKLIRLQALSDARGRNIGGLSTDVVNVLPF